MTVRIGMSEESVLQALAQAVVQTPLCQDYPGYDILIPAVLEGGINCLNEKCKQTPRIPLKPMPAHPTMGVHKVLKRASKVKTKTVFPLLFYFVR